MSKLEKIAPTGTCQRLHVSAADFRKIKKIDHLRMLFLLQLIREFEDTLLKLKDENLVHGPVHSSIGQEANAAAAAVVLKKSDLVGSTHRAHGHFLAKAIMYYAPQDFDPGLHDLTNLHDQSRRQAHYSERALAAAAGSGARCPLPGRCFR
jgi:2-oxoisovalerate dehydrogenase E1 component